MRSDCTTCTIQSGRPPQVWRNGTFSRNVGGIDHAIAPSHYMSGILRERLDLTSSVIPNFVPRPVVRGQDPSHFLYAGFSAAQGFGPPAAPYSCPVSKAELAYCRQRSLKALVKDHEGRTRGKGKGWASLNARK